MRRRSGGEMPAHLMPDALPPYRLDPSWDSRQRSLAFREWFSHFEVWIEGRRAWFERHAPERIHEHHAAHLIPPEPFDPDEI